MGTVTGCCVIFSFIVRVCILIFVSDLILFWNLVQLSQIFNFGHNLLGILLVSLIKAFCFLFDSRDLSEAFLSGCAYALRSDILTFFVTGLIGEDIFTAIIHLLVLFELNGSGFFGFAAIGQRWEL